MFSILLKHREQVASRTLSPARQLFHHSLHLSELGHQLVYFLNGVPTPPGNTPLAATIQDFGIFPLFRRHRLDDRLDEFELIVCYLVRYLVAILRHTGDHVQQLSQRAQLFDLLKLT